jgi:hypothetical protein
MNRIDAMYAKAQVALENGRKAVLMLNDPKQDVLLASLAKDAASVERMCKGPTAAFSKEDVVMNYAARVLSVAQRQAKNRGIDLGDLD